MLSGKYVVDIHHEFESVALWTESDHVCGCFWTSQFLGPLFLVQPYAMGSPERHWGVAENDSPLPGMQNESWRAWRASYGILASLTLSSSMEFTLIASC